MDQPNLDLTKIKQLFHDTNIVKAANGEPAIMPDGKVRTQAPGYSPLVAPTTRKTKYTKIQLDECVKLSRTIGTELACIQMGVNPSSLYGYAKQKSIAVGKAQKRRNVKPVKYSPEQLDRVVKLAMEWHRTTSKIESMRKCCLRAGQHLRINGHTAYGHYNLHREAFKTGAR